MTNDEYQAMRQSEVLRLRKCYDFTTLKGIQSIPVPCKEVNGNSPTGRVEYYLRGQCFNEYWKSGKYELAIACLMKAQELMFISDMIWRKDDFMRLVTALHDLGLHADARREEARIDKFFSKQDIRNEQLLGAIETAKKLHTDFIEAVSEVCCEECAKYTGRLFSISGRGWKFPPIPKEFFNRSSGHNYSCLHFYAYKWGIDKKQDAQKKRLKRKAYKDRRTKEEIERYNAVIRQKEEVELRERESRQNQADFYWIQEYLPDICPKSVYSYVRMKNACNEKYLTLVREAVKFGKQL